MSRRNHTIRKHAYKMNKRWGGKTPFYISIHAATTCMCVLEVPRCTRIPHSESHPACFPPVGVCCCPPPLFRPYQRSIVRSTKCVILCHAMMPFWLVRMRRLLARMVGPAWAICSKTLGVTSVTFACLHARHVRPILRLPTLTAKPAHVRAQRQVRSALLSVTKVLKRLGQLHATAATWEGVATSGAAPHATP